MILVGLRGSLINKYIINILINIIILSIFVCKARGLDHVTLTYWMVQIHYLLKHTIQSWRHCERGSCTGRRTYVLEAHLRCIPGPGPFAFTLLFGWYEDKGSVPPCPSTMIFGITSGTETWNQPVLYWKLSNCELKLTPFP